MRLRTLSKLISLDFFINRDADCLRSFFSFTDLCPKLFNFHEFGSWGELKFTLLHWCFPCFLSLRYCFSSPRLVYLLQFRLLFLKFIYLGLLGLIWLHQNRLLLLQFSDWHLHCLHLRLLGNLHFFHLFQCLCFILDLLCFLLDQPLNLNVLILDYFIWRLLMSLL